ncbi:uncharacterized protein LOC133299392 [Gastrolobium bilobum]|uniref:uncharacterized protein LOC133299392 n=1 Tax=Gastrolobium bilobum TaxID=150636 RepID=UPI002AB120AE|nr:uncharacterized protein LOC133299392 [Gastrolobium bilobum]
MCETNDDEPYAFMVNLSRISSSQEEHLNRNIFVGDTHNDNAASPIYGDFPVSSAGIVMVSLPESQEEGAPQDVFHTPPEESSLPTSDDQRRTVTVDVDRCAINQVVDVDCGTQGFVDLCGYSDGTDFVDLGRDSELGFSDVPLTQEIDGGLVAECSHGVEGDRLGEIPECQFDEFGVLQRELSDLGELPVKKLKLSDKNLGFDSSRDCFGIQLQKVEEGVGDCKGKLVSEADTESPCNFGEDHQPQENVLDGEQIPVDAGKEDNCCREISMDKNLGCGENFETQVVQLESKTNVGDVEFCEGDKLPCTVEGNKSSDGVIVIEASRRQESSDEEPGLRVLPISIRDGLENAANELESGKVREKKKCPVFFVLKVLSENNRQVEDYVDNVSLLEAAKLRGITFPRPRWWPDKDDFNTQ